MKRLKVFMAAVIAVFMLCTPAFAGAEEKPSNWPPHLRFLTGPKGGQWFTLGEPIAEVLTKKVLPTSSRIGGGVSNIANVNKKLGDVGFTLTSFLEAGRSGEAEYASLKAENAAMMMNVYPQVMYFLVRKDFAEEHNIKYVADLLNLKAPVRFASLKPGTASEFLLSLLLKYGYDTSFEKLRDNGWNVSFNNYAETADNFVAGDLDCFAYTAGTSVPLIKTIEEHTPITVLPIKQDVLDLLSGKFKTLTYVIQPGDYKTIKEPVPTLGDYTSFVVRKDLPDDLVYAICKTLWDNRRYMTGFIEDYGALSPETALPQGIAVHPGALKFWKELGAAK